jgi:pimeloyl-ACP methyl ester carboxylesterase
MLRVIPLLTTDFNLVIPYLIGFGFSDKPKGPGVNATLMGGLWVKLMRELGYEKFVAQGGDFGAMISTRMAMKYSEHLLGLHLNYIPFSYQPYLPKALMPRYRPLNPRCFLMA